MVDNFAFADLPDEVIGFKYPFPRVAAIATGLDRLRSRSKDMDVMLIDPQYVPAMLLDGNADLSERMVARISAAAEHVQVNVFHRWALMRHWHVHNNIAFERMIDPT